MLKLDQVKNVICKGSLNEMQSMLNDHPELITHQFSSIFSGTYTALRLAVESLDLEKLELLLSLDVPLEEHDFNLISLWVARAKRNDIGYDDSMLVKLRELGFDFPNSKSACRYLLNFDLALICFRKDDHELFDCLIKHGFDPVATENIAETSAIAEALSMLDNEHPGAVVVRMAKLGCSLKGCKDKPASPLVTAIEKNHWGLVKALLDLNAKLELPANDAEDLEYGSSHKVILGLLRNENIKRELLDKIFAAGLQFDRVTLGQPLVHWAARAKSVKLLEYLLENGVDINTETHDGKTPLMTAIRSGTNPVKTYLVEAGADVNVMTRDGKTALDMALKERSAKAFCKVLEQAGAVTGADCLLNSDEVDYAEIAGHNVDGGEAWVDEFRSRLRAMDSNMAQRWYQLIQVAQAKSSSKPTKKWWQETTKIHSEIDEDSYRSMMLGVLPLLHHDRTEMPDYDVDDYETIHHYTISENNTSLLKGLIWLCAAGSDEQLSVALRETATNLYKKVPNVGMRNAKLANACVYTLSQMPGDVGVKQIVTLRSLTKYNPALVNINRVFDQLAKSKGTNVQELEALSVPDYGLQDIGCYKQTIGDFTAILQLELEGVCSLVWETKDKKQKTVPASVKRDFPAELKSLKSKQKDLKAALSAVKSRLEGLYLGRNSFAFDDWKKQYHEHHLAAFHARRLIWIASDGKKHVQFYCVNGDYIDCSGKKVKLSTKQAISLWHPCKVKPEEVLNWRQFMVDNEQTQPFKQAHREVYLLTDAERKTADHSLRFANHILKLSQFHALATQRGWSQIRGGQWDGGSENSADRKLANHGLEVLFEAQGAEAYGTTMSGIYECVGTDRVIFYAKDKSAKLDKIDVQVFSEVMRDIDMFVSVCGIVNDPDWRENDVTYWDRQATADLSQYASTRHEVLKSLIPKLAIADKLSLEGKYLLVQGKLKQYKIHIGSGTIFMQPNDQYLCIVPTRRKMNLLLPFEGDAMLSLILSKAFMLVSDEKIKDPLIKSQLKAA